MYIERSGPHIYQIWHLGTVWLSFVNNNGDDVAIPREQGALDSGTKRETQTLCERLKGEDIGAHSMFSPVMGMLLGLVKSIMEKEDTKGEGEGHARRGMGKDSDWRHLSNLFHM
ncbi:hypothetical protein SLE2022_273190 [Rubroshorea leprosula]